MNDEYKSGQVSFAAGSFMVKWDLLNQHISQHPLNIQPGDDVNVFINLECVLRNLSMQKGLGHMISFHKQEMVIELESSILNLMAIYRTYFSKVRCSNVKLYFYITDLNDNEQQMQVYNKYYRSFYRNKYMKNPQFKPVGDLLNQVIIPEIELILLYVPGCYLIKSKTFDSSVIPYVISTFSSSKNVIISGDIFDTLYLLNPNFITLYIKRRFQHFSMVSDIDSSIQSIVKGESPFDLTIFRSEMYYRLLLAVKGSKIRNIQSSKGFGYGKLMNIIKSGLTNGTIIHDFTSIDSIIDIFPNNYRESIKSAFKCTSIETQFELLSDIDIDNVKSQIVDKSDMQSLEILNARRFIDYPIDLNGLIM